MKYRCLNLSEYGCCDSNDDKDDCYDVEVLWLLWVMSMIKWWGNVYGHDERNCNNGAAEDVKDYGKWQWSWRWIYVYVNSYIKTTQQNDY